MTVARNKAATARECRSPPAALSVTIPCIDLTCKPRKENALEPWAQRATEKGSKLDAAEAVAHEKHARDEAALAEVTQCTVSRHVVMYRIASRTPKHARGEAALAEASGAIESK